MFVQSFVYKIGSIVLEQPSKAVQFPLHPSCVSLIPSINNPQPWQQSETDVSKHTDFPDPVQQVNKSKKLLGTNKNIPCWMNTLVTVELSSVSSVTGPLVRIDPSSLVASPCECPRHYGDWWVGSF